LQVVAGLQGGDDVELVEDAVVVPVALLECGWLTGEVLPGLQNLDKILLVSVCVSRLKRHVRDVLRRKGSVVPTARSAADSSSRC